MTRKRSQRREHVWFPSFPPCALLLALFAATAGCAPDLGSTREGYGLRPLEIELDEENLSQILHGGLDESPVAARLRVGKERLQGYVSLAGQGSISHEKRGYRFDIEGRRGPFAFRSFRLSAQSQDDSFLASLLGHRVYSALGLPVPDIEPVSLYLNRQFVGLYLLIERIEPEFFERRGFAAERVYRSQPILSDFGREMIADPARGMKEAYGSYAGDEISRLAQWANGEPDAANLGLGSRLLDFENFTRFVAANLFLVNCDSFNNNLYLFRTEGDPRFRAAAWDWERAYDGTCTPEDLKARSHLVMQLYAQPELRAQVEGILAELRTSRFGPAAVRAHLDEDIARIGRAYAADPYLGGLGRDPRAKSLRVFSNYEKGNGIAQ